MAIFSRANFKAMKGLNPNRKVGPFYAPHYGLVRDEDVAVDPTLGDAELGEAIAAARAGDWKTVARIVADAGTDWDSRMLRVQALAEETKNTSAWLDAWRTAEPESPDVAVVHAHALVVLAWNVRGGQRGDQTTQEQFQGFHRLLKEADQAAVRAAELAPHDPTPWVSRLTAARGLTAPHETFGVLWNELLQRAPFHRRAHVQAVQYWCAKWSGSDELVTSFVATASATHPGTPLAVELNIHLLQERWMAVADKTAAEAADFYRAPEGRLLLDAALSHWDRTLPTGGAYALWDRNLLAWALAMAERYDEATVLFEAIGGAMVAGAPWIYYGNPRKAFVALREEAFHRSARQPFMTF